MGNFLLHIISKFKPYQFYLVLKCKILDFKKCLFYWSIVDSQCCVNFYCTVKWFSCTHRHTHTLILFIFFSIVVYHGILNIVPCAILDLRDRFNLYLTIRYLLMLRTNKHRSLELLLHIGYNKICAVSQQLIMWNFNLKWHFKYLKTIHTTLNLSFQLFYTLILTKNFLPHWRL